MAHTPFTAPIVHAAAEWKDRCLLGDGSMFSEREIWTLEHAQELDRVYVQRPDLGDRTFIDKLRDQLADATVSAKQLAAEMAWLLLLFPSNIRPDTKAEQVRTIWSWSGISLPPNDPRLEGTFGVGVGSGGQAFNMYRWAELTFLVRLTVALKSLPRDQRVQTAADPWRFAGWLDGIEGAGHRQFRHMLLWMLFPETFERISSTNDKQKIERAFRSELGKEGAGPVHGSSPLALDRRLWDIRQRLEAGAAPGEWVDYYENDRLRPRWTDRAIQPLGGNGSRRAVNPPRVHENGARIESEDDGRPNADAPSLEEIGRRIRGKGLRITDQFLRRYHLALKSRGFAILSGISGTGKTWLAQAYAEAVGARSLTVAVAPNWTTNEDLLGYYNPTDQKYHDTEFSRFLREAADEWGSAGEGARDYHLVLDEMNLARVEYYFARFLSAMEVLSRGGEARIELGPDDDVVLPPNLRFIGTVNVDETTHGFADKVYDRAQLIELEAPREALVEHLGDVAFADRLLRIWDAVHGVAPFAFRVLDEVKAYVREGTELGAGVAELLDEQMLQKVLPKVKGTDPRIGEVLEALHGITADEMPLTHAKVAAMRDAYQKHGFASFF